MLYGKALSHNTNIKKLWQIWVFPVLFWDRSPLPIPGDYAKVGDTEAFKEAIRPKGRKWDEFPPLDIIGKWGN